MKNKPEAAEAGRQFAAAYAVHYTDRDLPLALHLYRKLMASHPTEPAADYSRMQIQNIVNDVVPKQELMDAQLELLVAHFKHDGDESLGENCIPAAPLKAGQCGV